MRIAARGHLEVMDELPEDLTDEQVESAIEAGIYILQRYIERRLQQRRLLDKTVKRSRKPPSVPKHIPVRTGLIIVMELFNNNGTVTMSKALGMTPTCFAIFVKQVRLHTDIVPSKHVTVEEKLAMLLYWLRSSESYRKLDKVFKRSLDTISRYLPETLGLLVHSDLRKQYVVQPTADTPTSSVITDDLRFARYFGDCIGAIDGTLGPWYSTAHDAERWIDRNGDKTQNILAATNFDHRFCYLQSGCEGSARDQQAWDWARERDLVIPEGKYYLGDAGFATSEECMTPYRNVRYLLKEWVLGSQSPQNPQELFNLRHASLRNAVERIIRVTKRQFGVLVGHPRELPAEHQARIPHACALLHNFIQINDPINARTGEPRSVSTEEEEWQLLREIAAATDLNDSENEYHPDSDRERQRRAHVSTSASKRRMEDLRDEIAERMWADYQTYEAEARRLATHAPDEQSIRRAELRELYLLWTREI